MSGRGGCCVFLIICAMVLYCSVLCSFCWILFWMCNLFNLYLLVLFHLLKAFVSWCFCLLAFIFYFYLLFVAHWCTKHYESTSIQTVDTAFEPNQCQINIAVQEHTFGSKRCTQRDERPDPGYFCFLLNTDRMAACHYSCQNLWEMLSTSMFCGAPNNNGRMRQCNPKRGKSSACMLSWSALCGECIIILNWVTLSPLRQNAVRL